MLSSSVRSCFRVARHYSRHSTSPTQELHKRCNDLGDSFFRSMGSTALAVSAANSTIGQGIIPRALEQGSTVYAFTGNAKRAESTFTYHPNLKFVEVDHSDYEDVEKMRRAMEDALDGDTYDHFGVINPIGGTSSSAGTPDSPEVLTQKNVDAPQAFVGGVLSAAKDQSGSLGVTNLSSIAASITPDGKCYYADCRRAGEEAVNQAATNLGARVTQLRIGLVQPKAHINPETGKPHLDSGHKHSVENWRNLPIVTVAGSDETPLQQPVGLGCVARGAIKGALRQDGDQVITIDGVSRQVLTQREYLTYLSDQRQVLCAHIPTEVLRELTKITSEGRLQPYAINIIETLEKNPELLDPTGFEELLGTEARTLEDIYKPLQQEEFTHKGLELSEYVYEMARSMAQNPMQAAALMKTAALAKGWGFSVMEKG